jgi:prophage regulatory protein
MLASAEVSLNAPRYALNNNGQSELALTLAAHLRTSFSHYRGCFMPEPEKILRIRTVLTRTGLSRSTIYRKMKDGTFPSQIRISEHCSGWRESEINSWIGALVHYRDSEQARGNLAYGPKTPPRVSRKNGARSTIPL